MKRKNVKKQNNITWQSDIASLDKGHKINCENPFNKKIKK